MSNKVIEIQGEDVDFLKAIPGVRKYHPKKPDEKTGEMVDNTESPLYGKEYRLFAYNDKVFTANTEDEFCKLYDDEQLWKIRLSEDAAGNLSLIKGISIKRSLATARTSSDLKKIYRQAEAFTPASEELLSAFNND
jgi:hypothetical protein